MVLKRGILAAFWHEVSAACNRAGIAISNIEKERGREQHEVSLMPSRDVAKIIADTNHLKQLIITHAELHGMQASFAAKPLADDYGNGLHIHVHLEDEAGKNLYWKKDEAMSDTLAHSIAGLLATMQENMPIFAPTPESRMRFAAGSNAPLTVSWGRE